MITPILQTSKLRQKKVKYLPPGRTTSNVAELGTEPRIVYCLTIRQQCFCVISDPKELLLPGILVGKG